MPARSQTRGQGLAYGRQRCSQRDNELGGRGARGGCPPTFPAQGLVFPPPEPTSWLAEPCQGLTTGEVFSYVFLSFSLHPWPPALRLGRAWSCHLPPTRNICAASGPAAPGAEHPWCSLPAAPSPSGGGSGLRRGSRGTAAALQDLGSTQSPKLRGQRVLEVSERSSAAAACWRPEASQEPCT